MTGLLRFPDPVVALPLLGLILWRNRRRAAAILPAAALAGVALALVARFHDAGSCAARLPAGTLTLAVRLVDPSVSGVARARPTGAGCHGVLSLRFNRPESLPAGAPLSVTGRWLPRTSLVRPASGMLVVASSRRIGTLRPNPAERLRTALTEISQRLYGTRAPMVDALILGTRGGMDADLREDFARSGLVHLLSISGFHVGLITSWTLLLLLAAGVSRPRAYLVAAALSVGYVAFLGWQAPATRAAGLGVLIALGVIRQRSVRAPALLSATCLVVVVVDPWAVFDLGAWLSAGSLAGVAVATEWSDRALGPHWGWRMLAASVGATLATAPLTAATLGAVAPIGILLNFAAIPVAALAVPGVIASLVAAALAPPLSAPLAAGSGLALAALEWLARVGGRVPGGHLVTDPSWQSAVPWLVLLGVAGWGLRGGTTAGVALRRWGLVAAAGSWLWLGADAVRLSADGGEGLTLHFLDVGQGDGALIRTPGGRWVLVDAGPADRRIDAGRRVVAPFLARHRVRRLDAALISHAHADHLGGLPAVLRRVPATVILEPGMPTDDGGYRAFLDWAAAEGQPWRPARRGEHFTLDGVRFEILHPDTTWSWWGLDLNESSLVVRVEWGAFSALLTGDAGFPAESLLAGRLGRVDLLKVGHHGSRGSTGERFLRETAPRVAVISAGRNNLHGHPAPDALARLGAAGARIFRTDRDGSVRVSVTPSAMTIRGATGVATFPLRP